VEGKFLCRGGERLWVRGITYGSFRPDASGDEYPPDEVLERDFAVMAAHGINCVRTYTVPPRRLLDAAERHGLLVLIGIPWEQHVAFLSDRRRAGSIEERVGQGVRACAGHPAVLCYAIGNEIPASIARWHGRRRLERFLRRIYDAAKVEDPGGLVTYVNFPSTEYLQLPFLDLVCFNVYLEAQDRLEAYLARLQNIAGDRPLVLAELGLDSLRNGEDVQAEMLESQVRACFAGGCAGAFVFAWTDEWHRGGYDVEDWAFGLVDRARRPKPALDAVREAFAEVPFSPALAWPRATVVVCTHNGAATLGNTCSGLAALDYPDYEVIVVDDGSSDGSAAIAADAGFTVVSTPNRGLSSARNTGLELASGEIVAYLDDDARPDPHWLRYLAATFLSSDHAAVGGPNLPPQDGMIAEAVANAPGGPIHVLLSDREAEHIPGCNMAFRREALEDVGRFDPQFRAAGDDVDVCWRLREAGRTLGFHPAALVWHRRRGSIAGYWRQQRGYGRAEALLERKWPAKYNRAGHVAWTGRLYGPGLAGALFSLRWRVYYGTWGSGEFQSLEEREPGTAGLLPLMPEWYLLVAALAQLSVVGLLWRPLLLALVPLAAAVGLLVVQAWLSSGRTSFDGLPGRLRRRRLRLLTFGLYLLQPVARLAGRLGYGLTPWRRRGSARLAGLWPRQRALWSEQWRDPGERLRELEEALVAAGFSARRGGDYDRWDVEVLGGMLGAIRVRTAVEEHGSGRQLTRVRSWPRCSPGGSALALVLGAFAAAAAVAGAWAAAAVLGVAGLVLFLRAPLECAVAAGALERALDRQAAAADDLAGALAGQAREAARLAGPREGLEVSNA
jgi:GT2 family glycosyltransferase